MAAAQTDEARRDSAPLLRALVMLAIDEREQRLKDNPSELKTEVLLAAAGLDSSEIATLVGKQPGSVRTTLSRARRGGAASKDPGNG